MGCHLLGLESAISSCFYCGLISRHRRNYTKALTIARSDTAVLSSRLTFWYLRASCILMAEGFHHPGLDRLSRFHCDLSSWHKRNCSLGGKRKTEKTKQDGGNSVQSACDITMRNSLVWCDLLPVELVSFMVPFSAPIESVLSSNCGCKISNNNLLMKIFHQQMVSINFGHYNNIILCILNIVLYSVLSSVKLFWGTQWSCFSNGLSKYVYIFAMNLNS